MMKYARGREIPLEGIEDKDKATVDHVPFIERQIVDVIGNEIMVRNAQGLEHGLLPKATAAFDTSNGIDDAEGQNTFDRSRDDA